MTSGALLWALLGCSAGADGAERGVAARAAEQDGAGAGSGVEVGAEVEAEVERQAGRGRLPAEQWPDACALLLEEDVAPLLGPAPSAPVPGVPAEQGDGGPTTRPVTCQWNSADGLRSVQLRIDEVLYPIDAYWASVRIRLPSARDVAGVGDEAVQVQRPDGAEAIVVCQGRTVFEVALTQAPPRPDEPDGSAVADEHALAPAAARAASRVTGPAGESPTL